MIHYTLNTGHARHSPRSEVGQAALTRLRRYTLPGIHRLPSPLTDYELRVTIEGGLLATVSCKRRPLVTFGVATTQEAAEQLWPALESFYLRITELPGFRAADFKSPRRPGEFPWCAAVVMAATKEEAYWIADFERCLAWTYISSRRADNETQRGSSG